MGDHAYEATDSAYANGLRDGRAGGIAAGRAEMAAEVRAMVEVRLNSAMNAAFTHADGSLEARGCADVAMELSDLLNALLPKADTGDSR